MKKILSILLVAMVLMSALTTAYAAVDTSAPILFKAAKGTPIIDGVMDDAYLESDEIPVEAVADIMIDGQATAKVRALWDDECIYVYAEVKDNTPSASPGEDVKSWEVDSVEIYIDMQNNKDVTNMLRDSEYAAQLRLCRDPSFTRIDGAGMNREEFAANTTYKIVEKGDEGYVVEAAVKHKALTGKIGFAFQVNDDMNGDRVREAVTYIKPEQNRGWGYTCVQDTLELIGCTATNGFEDDTIVYNDASILEELKAENTPADTSSEASSETPSEIPSEEPSQTPSETVSEMPSAEPSVETSSVEAPVDTNPEGISPIVWVVVAVAVVAVVVVIVLLTKKGKKN